MLPYRNNLKKGDPVIDAETKRPGRVHGQPRETTRHVGVVFQGNFSPKTVDVMRLRLVVDGKPEDVPPVDGEPPSSGPKGPVARTSQADSEFITIAKRERERNLGEMAGLERRFKELKAKNERLDRAILVLEAPGV